MIAFVCLEYLPSGNQAFSDLLYFVMMRKWKSGQLVNRSGAPRGVNLKQLCTKVEVPAVEVDELHIECVVSTALVRPIAALP
jgi:hypothetical protein